MPTRHEQGDLNIAVYGAHGEVQRAVLAPTSVMDCFWTTIDAFNLAEEFQLPVIVLQDTVLAVRTESIPKPDLSSVNVVNRRTFAYRDTGASMCGRACIGIGTRRNDSAGARHRALSADDTQRCHGVA